MKSIPLHIGLEIVALFIGMLGIGHLLTDRAERIAAWWDTREMVAMDEEYPITFEQELL
jgi:hypothetical protein